jgi:thiamine-phosphate pyrophosphorylase
MTGPAHSQLVVNDRIDVALVLDDAGVHLRSSSLPVAVARRLMGVRRLLGVSAHSMYEVEQAEGEGADYVVLGPIYETPSKQRYGSPLGLALLEEACRRVRIPVLGIGGITPARAREVRGAGAFGVAAIGAILGASDCAEATRALIEAAS